MNRFNYLRPRNIEQARAWLIEHPDARLLAGGQSLLAAMKLGLNAPSHLIDLQDIPGLNDVSVAGDELWIGAMATHARVAAAPEVLAFAPMLAQLAGGIADAQVREVGTLGGSLANNDPAACWPAGVLCLGATIVTSAREIAADDFFQGLYGTVLARDEVLLGLRFPRALAAHYRLVEASARKLSAEFFARLTHALVGAGQVAAPARRGALARVWSGWCRGRRRWFGAG